jgi:archaellum biogenesis ATPase FlaH
VEVNQGMATIKALNTLKTKKELINVSPRTKRARNRFINQMDSLHACVVEKRQDGKVFLASISGKYFFWMNESADDHWEIVK